MSLFGQGWSKLSKERQRIWKVGAGVVAVGTIFKVAYFNFSRGLMVQDMDARHLLATENLKKSREFGEWAARDRVERTPQLTSEQRKQLREYLSLMAEMNPEVFPNNGGVAAGGGESRRRRIAED
uniref:Uncharacterized protein n=1 Tax=Ditylum brightwellii TaxID=49249 RepID=A0A7S4SV15_9STRA